MKSIYRNILVSLIAIASVVFIAADFPLWEVPPEANEIENPVEADKMSIDEGSSLFKTQCVACHGAGGKGDGALPSADLTSKIFSDQSDGAIFYKIQNGRGTMPAFKALGDDAVWNLVNYIRTLGGEQVEVIKRKAKVKLELKENEGAPNEILITVNELLDNGQVIAAKEVKTGVYVERYFGLLPIGGTRHYTGEGGNICVAFPEDIPGDENGMLSILVKIEDSEFSPVEVSTDANWGIPKSVSNWENERALWKTNEYVPYWVIISYLLVTIGIWIGIVYVLLMIRKIKKIGDIVN
ncbi:MAG: cytochrome c [Bacteroidota bacterium]|nr:cytochrome c [Bacteroidota bacterium]